MSLLFRRYAKDIWQMFLWTIPVAIVSAVIILLAVWALFGILWPFICVCTWIYILLVVVNAVSKVADLICGLFLLHRTMRRLDIPKGDIIEGLFEYELFKYKRFEVWDANEFKLHLAAARYKAHQ